VAGVARMTRTRADGLVARWLPVVLWAIVISVLSSDAFSGEHTSGFLLPLLHTVFPGASPDTLLTMHGAIRKLAHVTEYAVLAVLVRRALERPERSLAVVIGLALLLCAGYAALDELHQTFVPSRTASPVDVGIDILGAALGLGGGVLVRSALSAGRRSPA
jgi:VanZ family protein